MYAVEKMLSANCMGRNCGAEKDQTSARMLIPPAQIQLLLASLTLMMMKLMTAGATAGWGVELFVKRE